MPDVLRIKRRAVGGAAGAPSSLAAAEIAYNEVDNTLYYGGGNSGGLATVILPIAGSGAYLQLTGGTLTGPIFLPDGTLANPALSFTSTPNSGLYRSPGQLHIGVSGIHILQLASNSALFSMPLTTSGLITAASTTAAAGLRLPHGVAPTTPVDGDLWTTTAGLYARINAATVGPLGTGGGGTSIAIGDTPPGSPVAGAGWWNSTDGQLYIWYTDPNTSQWVPAVNTSAAAGFYLQLTGGTLTGSLTLPQLILQGKTWVGTSIAANANLYENSTWTGTPGGNISVPLRILQVSENIQVGTTGEVRGLDIHTTSTAGFTGRRIGGMFVNDITGTSGNTATTPYVALACKANGLVNDGGTALTAGNTRGYVFAQNPVAHLGPSATFWTQLVGEEINTWAEAGSSVYEKIGLQIVDVSGSATSGASDDIAFSMNNQYTQGSGAGWSVGISFGRVGGQFPIKSTGTMIGAATQSGTLNVAHGIDWSGVTFSSDSLKMPGFTVSGNGTLTVAPSTGGATGNLFVQPVAGPANLVIRKPTVAAGSVIQGAFGTLVRWSISLGEGTAEGGSNAGSNFTISRNNDAGGYIADAMQITRSSGACFNQGGTWTAISDPALKQDVEPFTRGLAAINKLEPIRFRYRAGTPFAATEPSDLVYGLMADQVESHMPELVGRATMIVDGKEREIQTLRPGDLVYALVNAVKELSAQVEALKAAR